MVVSSKDLCSSDVLMNLASFWPHCEHFNLCACCCSEGRKSSPDPNVFAGNSLPIAEIMVESTMRCRPHDPHRMTKEFISTFDGSILHALQCSTLLVPFLFTVGNGHLRHCHEASKVLSYLAFTNNTYLSALFAMAWQNPRY